MTGAAFFLVFKSNHIQNWGDFHFIIYSRYFKKNIQSHEKYLDNLLKNLYNKIQNTGLLSHFKYWNLIYVRDKLAFISFTCLYTFMLHS